MDHTKSKAKRENKDPNVEWQKDVAKNMKLSLVQKILLYQSKPKYTMEELMRKNLNRIKEIYRQEVDPNYVGG